MNTVFLIKALNKLTIEKNRHIRKISQYLSHNDKISKTKNSILTEYTNRNHSIQLVTSNTIIKII